MLPRSRRCRLHSWAVVFGLLSAQLGPARAQGTGEVASPFNDRIGLPQNTAFHVIQDHQAFLWVGTNDGLTRFDGQSFVVFRHRRDDPASLSHNTVRRILEDRRHRLWIRTEAGLDRYRPETNQFQRYPVEAQQIFDDDREGVIVASPAGLHRYDAATDRFEKVVAFPLAAGSPSPADSVWGLRRTRDGTTWLTTEDGHLFGVGRDGTTRRLRLPWFKATILHEDPDGRLWVGHEDGIGVVDHSALVVVAHPPFDSVRGPVIAFSRGAGGQLWLGGGALYQTDDRGGAVKAVDTGNDPLTTPIHAILSDREELLWLATPRGLRLHDPYAKRWLDPAAAADARLAGGTTVMAVARRPGDRLWIGTLDRGLLGVPSNTACRDQVWALLPEGNGRVWVGSGHGLCAVDGNGTRRIPLARSGRAEPVVFTLCRDHAGAVWVGTTAGLFRLHPRSFVVERIDAVGEGNIEGLFVAIDGRIWASTSRSELYRIEPATLKVESFSLGGTAEFRGSEGFWAIAEVGDGRLWLGGDRGLFRFDPARRVLDAVDERFGVPVAPVYAILHDQLGRLWLSTRNGLLRLDRPRALSPGPAPVRHYTVDDGLPFAEFNRRAALASDDGWLAFGGMGGVVRFRPGDLRDNPHRPLAHILNVERSLPDGPPEIALPADGLVTLAAGDTGLIVHFTALTFTRANRPRLQYRMDGVDADWVLASDDRRARYPALNPGRYTFTVRATGGDGERNTSVAAITIVAPTPWWASWWFRASGGLVATVAALVVLRWILTRPLRRRVRALELEQRMRAERERISRDLHDHVGAQMTTLLSGIELAGLRASRGELASLQPALSDLGDEARRTIAQLREAVWSLRHDHIRLADLVAQVEDDLRNRQRVLPQPRLTCVSSGDHSIEIGSGKALHLFRIVQESVTNAIRHAGATSVRIGIEARPGAGIRVSVTDDGAFREPAADQEGTGLVGMRSRAAEIGAAFECRGSKDGTTIEVVVPRSA